MNTTDNTFWLYFAAIFVAATVLVFIIGLVVERARRPQLEYDKSTPLPGRKPRLADDGVPWYLKFLYARGKFSPRLLAAWLTAGYTVRIIEHWMSGKPILLGVILVPAPEYLGLVGALLGVFASLFTMGTVQTAVLGDLAPVKGPGSSDDKEPTPTSTGQE